MSDYQDFEKNFGKINRAKVDIGSDSEPSYFPIKIDNQIVRVGRDDMREWGAFINWIAQTSLFNAIKTDPDGTEIIGHGPDGDINITFILNKQGKKIDTPHDLPKEILLNFYQNSPWYREQPNNPVKLLLDDRH